MLFRSVGLPHAAVDLDLWKSEPQLHGATHVCLGHYIAVPTAVQRRKEVATVWKAKST